jgi:hypothetical protein
MAGQSAKKQAANNIKVLQQTHILTAAVYIITLFSRFYLHRPANNKAFYLTSVPLFISVAVLEKTGRPVIDAATKKIINEGQDLVQPGLVEYLFDIVYLTLVLNVLSILFGSNWVWWIYLAVPVFAGYKAYGLLQAGRALLGGGGQAAAAKDGGDDAGQAQKSKRQQKLEARGDKQKVRYR